mmetsp:Transcript_3613/g.7326  ORF Transcript_3613/g.7326 Transcript_3613/m.7326 type:complete len:173 (+) Transcript_3613:70-588(+)
MLYYTHWGLLMFAYLKFHRETAFHDAIAFALLTISLLAIDFIWIHENDVDLPGVDFEFSNLGLKVLDIPSHHLPTAYTLWMKRPRKTYSYFYGIIPLLLYRGFTILLGIDPYEMYRLPFDEIMACIITAAAMMACLLHGDVFGKLSFLPTIDFSCIPTGINTCMSSLSICAC